MAMVSRVYDNIYNSPSKKKKLSRKQQTTRLALAYSSELEEKATTAELVFKNFLDKYGFIYDFQKPFKHNRTFSIVDFYLPTYAVAIEIDGKYHDSPEQQWKDKLRTRSLMQVNQIQAVIRFSNAEVLGGNETSLLQKLVTEIIPQAEILLGRGNTLK